ncbi:MAG: nuclear transport factor 2 family protein [Leptonema sp. (in: Bacteria)]|nr:nuclear transport factor 2 family protein [Leptonema sp. (in: bacteria)]
MSTQSENQQLIQQFYEAFVQKDFETMKSSYHTDAVFTDPVFGELKGIKIGAMWQMLCERSGPDFKIEFSNIEANADSVSAKWQAWYIFAKTKRPIHNKISASFKFAANGKIINHQDSFSLYKWIRMALGIKGFFVGFLPSVQSRIRQESIAGLELFIRRKKIQ